ncbi:3-deoxy-D-manno-octulosonic acid transferase [Hydrogenophaga sp. PBL-H3]|uniref:3-deoxy-D-manno-octulosonic acid transferase n=1 Tax=Hydrogenophaga sp. PBL-H3 TaxID=434010 RepID=UPI0013205266|nr:glycosyltransferase N-terminal domain-containing protein [Hydrogenophaga sp. PBL-H3]QHE77292.1 3-deoxy-D-manno-octulosonic acid transferase [Hydrogenophaga sp. PBL-H3]QHE81716.1 3-deoxy-D-manno-octulosonic acid transferase [Hydrogenophaga sp. PBL-H3]
MKPARPPWALRAYLVLARWLAPVWHKGLQRRLLRGKETPRSVRQKLGSEYADRPTGPLVWGHAVGVGESMALAGLFARLAERRPDCSFLITTTARTSGDALRRTGLPARCQHQFAPVDTPEAVSRFLDHWRPSLALWCEMDLWPALIAETDARAIPRALVNARLSPESLAKRRWGRWLYQALLPGFRDLFAQNEATADALVALGAPRERITISGTIKALVPPLGCDAVDLETWQQALAGRPVWLLASSHPGEEALALAAHVRLCEQRPGALLIIAPRAPARGLEVAALASAVVSRDAPLRSAGAHIATRSPVYIADTIGEMGLWYRLAPVALVGGSFASVGGHNPHEPLALGCAVLHGPNVWNFAESYERLNGLRQARPVNSEGDVIREVAAVWGVNRPVDTTALVDEQAEAVIERVQALLPR